MQERRNCARQLAAVLLGAGLVFGFAGASAAGSISASFDGFILPDDDSGIEPSVTINFAWNDLCVSDCTLRIDLIYNDSNGGLGLESQAQGLAGVTWDMVGGAALRTLANQTAADVIAPTLVAGQSATAIAELNNITIDGVSGEEVTAHWGLRTDLASIFPTLGTNILSSVGDVNGLGPGQGFMGNMDLLPGGITSSVEPVPPDGIPFAVVDPFTTALNGAKGDVVQAQGSSTAFLTYDGSLTGIETVMPLFGTDGVVIPEPSTGLLLGLGLLGLAAHRRRR